MPSIGTVTADLVLNSASFISNFQKAADEVAKNTRQINQNVSSMQNTFSAAGNFIKGFVGAFLSAEGIRSIVNLGISAVNAADEIGKAAQRIGASAEELQAFRYAADQANVSTSELDSALKVFGSNFAQGKLATDQQTLTGALEEYIARIEEAPTFLQRAQIAAEGFGRQWQTGLQLAAEGANKFAENASAAFTISDELVRKADTIKDKWAGIKDAIVKGFQAGFLREIGKGVDEQTEKLQSWKEQLNSWANTAGAFVANRINDLVAFANFLKELWREIVGIISDAIAAVERFVARVADLGSSIKSTVQSWMPGGGGGGLPPLSMDFFGGGGGGGGGGPTFPGWGMNTDWLTEAFVSAFKKTMAFTSAGTNDPFLTQKPFDEWAQNLYNAGEAAKDRAAKDAAAAAEAAALAAAAKAAGNNLGGLGRGTVDALNSLSGFGRGLAGTNAGLDGFGGSLNEADGYVDNFGRGLSGCVEKLGQFAMTLGGFGTGLGAAGLGLNSFNQGLMGIIATPGFSSGIQNFMRPGPNDFSTINLSAWRSGVDMAFQKGMDYINTMLGAGLTSIGSDFIRWQGSLRSRYIIMDENGNYRIGTAIPYDAVGAQSGTPGDFTFALAKKAQAQAAIAAQIAAAEQAAADKKAAKEAKKKQKELEETIATEDKSFQGTVSAGKQIPSVHITLEGTTNLFTREQVIALIDQMGEAIGDGARISIS